ncbi:hypothetical protein PEM37_39445 [Streptomyces sp. AD681]|uniref:hypothetical protein n=1 Tax=Streptomyces sp. AD681 TaxID=3019069 RepID=UPI0022F17247|nr:hypothetical protein [Streptomyces sp. AD681]MDA5147574.1 hypothetical protein [Streptomyces sp. AD681]
MDAVLPVLTKKLADTWLTMLALPGLLFVAMLVVAHAAGHQHALDGRRVLAGMEELARSAQRSGSVGTVVLLSAAVAVAAVAGYTARALGAATQWVWLGSWGRPDGRLTRRRQNRWQTAQDRYAERVLNANATPSAHRELAELAATRNRIALARPARPTWIGDRFAAAETRVWAEYAIDLGFCWPRLWLVLPEEARSECAAARTAFDAASGMAGWGLLYMAVGCWWWPAALVGLGLVLVAWWRGRGEATAFAELIESVVDVYGAELARCLADNYVRRPLDEESGAAISARARKDA